MYTSADYVPKSFTKLLHLVLLRRRKLLSTLVLLPLDSL
jgi:hypothetical protein